MRAGGDDADTVVRLVHGVSDRQLQFDSFDHLVQAVSEDRRGLPVTTALPPRAVLSKVEQAELLDCLKKNEWLFHPNARLVVH